MSRLGLGLGLSRGRAFSPFDPLSLNPIIAYEMQESMMAPLASESLDLDPANPSSLDIITATRAGTATYTDASGNIQTASPNTVRVDHVQGEELTPTKFQRVKYTDFSSGWVNNGSSDVAGSGYSGQPSVVITGTQNNASLYFNCPAVVGQEYIISMYIRRVSGTGTIRMRHVNAVEGTATDVTITNDWSRVEVPFTANSTSIPIGPQIAINGESVEIAMPQVEEGTTASSFVANTTGSPKYFAAATYAPRVPMILVEPAATNLVVNSEDFSQDVTLSNCTVQSGFTAPDASTNAYKLIEDNTNSLKLFRANNNTNTTASTSHSSSIFVKAGERTKVRIYAYHLTNQFFAVDYDLISNSALGTVTSNTQVDGHSIEDCGNGWKRITVTGQKASTYSWDVGVSPLDDSGNVTYTGDGTSGVYIWGAQLEQGAVATSYIPTSGSTVTRAADNLDITGSDFTNFYNTSEGTFYVEFTPKDITVGEQYLLRGGDSNRRIIYSNGNLSNIRSYDGANILTMSNNVESNALHRIAVSFDSTTMKGSFNGETEVTATHNGNLLTSSLLQIGSNYIGHIKRLIYWPHHSDNL